MFWQNNQEDDRIWSDKKITELTTEVSSINGDNASVKLALFGFTQARKQTAMIKVGVGQDDKFYFCSIKGEAPGIFSSGFRQEVTFFSLGSWRSTFRTSSCPSG